MESGDDGLESEANVRPRPCLTGAGSPGAQSTATDRGPSRQARLNRSAEGARTAYSARHTCPKTPETQSRNRSVRQAASLVIRLRRPFSVMEIRSPRVAATTVAKLRAPLGRPRG